MTQELLLKLPPLTVDPAEPFGNDQLGRKLEIENLTRVIKTNASPLVMAVDSPWGTGKTVFIKMWAAYINKLNKEGKARMRALHFNAWETDFVADPLVSFLAAMEKQLSAGKQDEKAGKQKRAKELTAFIKKGKILLPTLMGVGAGIGAGWLGAGALLIGGATKVTQKAVEELTEKKREELADNVVNSCDAQIKAIQGFKGALAEYIKTSEQRIVIFVDELDRCRPDYAVKVLERIKHLFEVNGLTFVLAMDRRQLQHSIRGLYGAGLDADKYLRRFIDFDYAIKAPAMGVYWDVISNALGTNNFLEKMDSSGKKNMRNPLLLLGRIYEMHLRDAEQFMLRLNLVLSTLADEKILLPELLTFLMVLREQDREVLNSYLASDGSEEIVEYWVTKVKGANIKASGDNADVIFFAGYTTAGLISAKHSIESGHFKEKHKEYAQQAQDERISREDRLHANGVAKCMEFCQERHLSVADMLRAYMRKIELLDQFKLPD